MTRGLRLSGVARLDYDRLSHGTRVFTAGSPFEQALGLDRVRARTRDDLAVSGNLGAYLFPLPSVSLRVDVGTAARPPVPGKFSVFIPASASAPGRVGNPELAPERSLDVEIGGEYTTGATQIQATAFVTWLFDYMIEYTIRELRDPSEPGHRYRTFGNQHALLRGFEIGVRHALLGRWLQLRATASFAVGSLRAPIADSPSQDTDLPLVPPLRGFIEHSPQPLPALRTVLRARYSASQDRNSDLAGEAATPMYALLDLRAECGPRRLWFLQGMRL